MKYALEVITSLIILVGLGYLGSSIGDSNAVDTLKCTAKGGQLMIDRNNNTLCAKPI